MKNNKGVKNKDEKEIFSSSCGCGSRSGDVRVHGVQIGECGEEHSRSNERRRQRHERSLRQVRRRNRR